MLSELDFASFLVYPTNSNTQRGRAARSAVWRIKHDAAFSANETWAQFAARRLREEAAEGRAEIERFLGPAVTLVPVPRSGLHRPGDLWPAERICECLEAEGLGTLLACLERREPLPTHLTGDRSDLAAKYRTLRVQRGLNPPKRIAIVDDVITEGETLLAAASRVQEAFPTARVAGFAIARTQSCIADVENTKDPCVGKITLTGNNSVNRDP